MNKKFKKVVAIVLCSVMLLSPVTAFAADGSGSSFKADFAAFVSDTLNSIVDGLLDGISSILPATVKIKDPSTHKSDNFLAGTATFIDEPKEGAKWSLGYASASILPDDFKDGKYYKGGYDINLKLSECADDLKVRLIALDDGSGRGTELSKG